MAGTAVIVGASALVVGTAYSIYAADEARKDAREATKEQNRIATETAAKQQLVAQENLKLQEKIAAEEKAARKAELAEKKRQTEIAKAAAKRQTEISAAEALRERTKSEDRRSRRSGGSLLTGAETGTTGLMKDTAASSLATTLG